MSLSLASHVFLNELTRVISLAETDGEMPRLDVRSYLIGNGGSAAIASHIANDMVKTGWDAFALTDPAVLTCMANDEGYENVYEEQLYRHAMADDLLIAISSSGKSENIINAVTYAREKRMNVITCSGFSPDNTLRRLGHYNIYIPSDNYGVVECAHLAILHSLVRP